MERLKDLISFQSSRFTDDYDVYIDYGKGQPIQRNHDETTLIDVEKFLLAQAGKSITNNNKKSNEKKLSIKTNYIDESETDDEPSLSYKPLNSSVFHFYNRKNINPQVDHEYHSTFTPHRSHQNVSSIPPNDSSNILYDETCLSSHKQINTDMVTFIDHIDRKFNIKSDKHQLSNTKKASPRKLFLHIAVNGISKFLRGKLPSSNINLINGDFGDDAGIFIENDNLCFVGLADGAGGNRAIGLNPADFSRAILSTCAKILNQNNFQSNQLSQVIIPAMKKIQLSQIRGSSTLCLLALDKRDHILTSLNIGDSGFVIYRKNKLYFRSTCTMNSDGCGPRQVFALDNSYDVPFFMNENEILDDCSIDKIKVEKNDLIILSSDGLWDVLDADQLQDIIERNINNDLQNLADDLLNQAISGYTINNRDDILVIVSRVDEL